MVWLVFTVIFALIAVALFGIAASAKRSENEYEKRIEEESDPYGRLRDKRNEARMARKGFKIAGFVVIGLAVISTGFNSFYTQDVGKSVVIRNLGGTVAGFDETPGFSIKAPWQSTVAYDIRNQVITMAGDGRDQDGPAIEAQTKDNITARIDINVRYSINPAAVADIYSVYRTQENLLNRALYNDLRSIVREIPVNYPASSFRQERAKVQTEISKALSERWSKLGIILDQVDLRDVSFPQSVQESLDAVQQRTADIAKAQADLEIAKINAEQVKTDARAQADADQIIRCGAIQKTVTRTINGKETDVIEVTPVAIADCQNRLNEQVLTSKYIEMLKEAAAKGNTVYVIPEDANSLLTLGGTK